MAHRIVLKLTTTPVRHSSGVMIHHAESQPYRCICGIMEADARTVVKHLQEAREQEPCISSPTSSADSSS